ncbi:MAG: DNA mismatch repair endonuclease MutL, partial [Chloroflexota bacterium]
VIERPASVVKELVENAIDAGASNVTVELQDGGIRLIRVRDDGCGLAPDEALLAFERHATSKIGSADDLLRIATLGFRGEALPSITAVAEVSFLTRPATAEAGEHLLFRHLALTERGPRAAPVGTTVTVRDLFHDFPARLKFLRTPATETSQSVQVVSQYALGRPDVRFTLIADGKRMLQTPGSGELRDAAGSVLGAGIGREMLEIAPATANEPPGGEAGVEVRGLVSPPGLTRASRGAISLFVNGRWVQNRPLTFGVQEAYQGLLMVGRHPIAVLYIDVASDLVDVNVHPRKLEVRFKNEGAVYAAVQRAVRRTLVGSAPDVELRRSGFTPSLTVYPSVAQPALAFQRELAAGPVPTGAAPPAGAPPVPTRRMPILRVVGQVSNTYIIAEGPDGMYLVDQHAAHERVVFERIATRLSGQSWESQGLLEPHLIEVPIEELPLLMEGRPVLHRYGFLIEPFGDRQVLLRALPSGVRDDELQRLLAEVATGLREADRATDRVATTVACHSAVRAGDPLGLDAMRALIADLEGCQAPQTCPHGRPTMMHLSSALLEREFG